MCKPVVTVTVNFDQKVNLSKTGRESHKWEYQEELVLPIFKTDKVKIQLLCEKEETQKNLKNITQNDLNMIRDGKDVLNNGYHNFKEDVDIDDSYSKLDENVIDLSLFTGRSQLVDLESYENGEFSVCIEANLYC